MTTVFISDLHLSDVRGDAEQLFEQFLATLDNDCEALYILGDFFEVWVGDDVSTAIYRDTLEALKKLRDRNIPVYVMHGNRDFLLGAAFASQTGSQLIPDPFIINLYGTTTLLTHGDGLCTDDKEYQQFRTTVRNSAWQQQFLSTSAEQRLAQARQLRAESMKRTQEKSAEIMDVNNAAVESMARQHQVTRIIHGHTHRPGVFEFTTKGKPAQRFVLGDWHDTAMILRADASRCRLETIRL